MKNLLLLCSVVCILSCNNSEQKKFNELDKLSWKTVFSDDCTMDWTEKWTLDGLKAKVQNSSEGMSFYAGPKASEDSSNAVLWTKQDFQGDLKIEYDYTKLDTKKVHVNIIYIQATGEEPYDKDIALWSDERTVPAMRTYFNNMNTLHVSYAAYGNKNTDPGYDYIRVRRYMPGLNKGLKGTEVGEAYFRSSFFETGVPHHIVILKKGDDFMMKVSNDEQQAFYQWDLSLLPPITEGKIGLRHMHLRSSRYKNVVISQLN